MEKGLIHIYTGCNAEKTPMVIGRAVIEAAEGKSVVIIQFLNGRGFAGSDYFREMEPEIKFFHFEKSNENYEELPDDKKQEEIINIKNGLNFARKVLATGECDMLILDEVLTLVDKGILSEDELKSLIEIRDKTDIILTGTSLNDEIRSLADKVYRIEA